MQRVCNTVVAKAAGMRHPETLMEILAVTLIIIIIIMMMMMMMMMINCNWVVTW
jgi:hypothetical protein